MSGLDLIAKALKLPAGAQFRKCALQVNPHDYVEQFVGQPTTLSEEDYSAALIDKAVENDIQVLGITNHNHAGGVDAIRTAAQRKQVVVFPGFELSSTEGIHVLCLYNPSTSTRQLRQFLGEFGIRSPEPSSALCNKPLSELLACVCDQGGISIAAHITGDSGLLGTLTGQSRINAWKDANLHAVQIPGTVQDLPTNYRQIVQNKNPDYRRSQPAEANLAVAVVNAKDVNTPESVVQPRSSCWIKMSEVTIEGLRQAFLDPGSRIRLHDDPPPEEHSELVAIAWQGGFLDGVSFRFNSNLNALVGGRGAGKSTVIASLRYVLGLEPLGEDARSSHRGIVKNVIRSGTKISVLVHSHHPSPRRYRIERTIPNPPVVRDPDTNNVLNVAPGDIFPGMEIYGQHELSELTKSPDKLTQLLERFVAREESTSSRKRDIQQTLADSRSQILRLKRELNNIQEKLQELPGLEETLKRYREAGLEERLQDQSLLVREERILETANDRLASFREAVKELQSALPLDRAFVSARALQNLPRRKILARVDDVLEALSDKLEQSFQSIEAAFSAASSELEEIRSEFREQKAALQHSFESTLRDLQRENIDGADFLRLRKRIEGLQPARDRQPTLNTLLVEHWQRRRSLVTEWEDIKAEEFRALEKAGKQVSRKMRNRVRVRVDNAGNREPLFQCLREKVGGRLAETIASLRHAENFSLTGLVAACRGGTRQLKDEFGLIEKQAEAIAGAGESAFMQIEELDLASTTRIELNTAPSGQAENWQALDQLSTGQKATAVLLLVLLESKAPLVVDQPEDDLDNRFITEGIVPRVREEKRRRQFLFATHNANIPVLGDAELIVGLSAAGEAERGSAQIAREHMGSIDSESIRTLVEELLEGGEEAFERRRRKYGF